MEHAEPVGLVEVERDSVLVTLWLKLPDVVADNESARVAKDD